MFATAGLFLAAFAGKPQAQTVPETVIKAEMFRRFPDFVEWPAASLATKDEITLCFSNAHPFGQTIDGLANGPLLRGHGVRVRQLKPGDRPDGCHALYVASGDEALLTRVRQSPVLTVGDEDGFCQRGGIINLRVINGRVRFEVHLGNARAAGLKLDSQFVRLAAIVFGGHQ